MGYYIEGKSSRKTNEKLEYNSLLGVKTSGKWFASFFTNFRTQFTRGYDYSKTPEKLVSDVFSPAFLSFRPGFLWKKPDNIRMNISPETGRFTFVSSAFSGQYGVEKGKTENLSLGFNLSTYLKFTLMENVTMENIDINYQMNFLMNINKHLSLNITLHEIYDDDALGKLQFREVFGLGIRYTFQNKSGF